MDNNVNPFSIVMMFFLFSIKAGRSVTGDYFDKELYNSPFKESTVIPTRFISIYLLGNTLLWSIGFSLGLILGFSIPILGDILAVIAVGSLVLILQAQVLPPAISQGSWIMTTILGLVVGTALSFLVIHVMNRQKIISLKDSHIIGFPVIILGVVIFQGRLLFQEYGFAIAMNWSILSVLGLVLGMLIIWISSRYLDFDLQQLAVREKNYASVDNWAIMGAIIGFCYALITLIGLNQMAY